MVSDGTVSSGSKRLKFPVRAYDDGDNCPAVFALYERRGVSCVCHGL